MKTTIKRECKGHYPGPFDSLTETVYCDGSCRPVAIKGTGIFAGAYVNLDKVLTHACFDVDAKTGRLEREAGQALCSRKLNACAYEDRSMFEDASKVDCPACLAIVARINRRGR